MEDTNTAPYIQMPQIITDKVWASQFRVLWDRLDSWVLMKVWREKIIAFTIVINNESI